MTFEDRSKERVRRQTERGLNYIFWLLMVQNALLFAVTVLGLLVLFKVLP